MSPNRGVRSSTPPDSDFDFGFFLSRTEEMGATTPEQRAEIAGISLSTFFRLQRGDANLTLRKLREIATRLGVTRSKLLRTET